MKINPLYNVQEDVTLPMVPHNRLPAPSVTAMDGPPDYAWLPHIYAVTDHIWHLASPQLVPHSHERSPTAGLLTGVAASVAKYT